MSILILYESKTGFTEHCAISLQEHLPGSDIEDIHNDTYDLTAYDTILIGAPIYMGEIEHFTQRFFVRHKPKLLKKKLGIFCAGMNKEEFNHAVQNSLPPDIFYHANIVHCGGKIDYSTLSIKEKFTIRRRLGIKSDAHIENEDKMAEFIKWVKKD